MEMSKDFLAGGATAANQYEGGYAEGGRGLSVNDVEMGRVTESRERFTSMCIRMPIIPAMWQ